MSDPVTPSVGNPFTLKPDGRVSTNWQTLLAVIAATSVIVGGLFSVKGDIATASAKASTAAEKAAAAADDAKQALSLSREIKEEVLRIRWQLGLDAVTGSTSSKPTSPRSSP